MSGYVAIHRDLFDHPIFKDEPYTEREAWMWLIKEAAWKNGRVRVGGAWVNLERGELAHSLRHMQTEWKWKSEKRVRTFLKKLEKDGMIDTSKTTHGVTHLIVCNFDYFQPIGHTDGRSPDAARTQRRRKEEEGNKERIDDDGEDAREAPKSPLISPWAFDLAEEIKRICGFDPEFTPPTWCNAPMRIETWRKHDWQREICLASVQEQLAKKRDGPPSSVNYFEKGIARAHAQQSASLPEAPTTTARGPHAATQNLSAVARQLAASAAERGVNFGPKPSLSGVGNQANSPPVRLLSKG